MLVPGVFAITVVGSLVFSSYTIISSSLVAKMVKVSAYNAGSSSKNTYEFLWDQNGNNQFQRIETSVC